MFDIWMGKTNLGYVAIGAAVVMFGVQLLLCMKVKSKLIRLLPLGVCLLAAALLLALTATASGWDSLGYVVLALLVGMIALACGLGWAVWGVAAFLKKRKNC